jgi:hypothetical protein
MPHPHPIPSDLSTSTDATSTDTGVGVGLTDSSVMLPMIKVRAPDRAYLWLKGTLLRTVYD